jgi:hypothetical protein
MHYSTAHVDERHTQSRAKKMIERPEPLDLVAQLRSYRAKHVPPTAISPDDPLAIEKTKIERYLKKYSRTPADLPDDFWEQSKDMRGWMLGQIVGPAMGETKRLKRLAERGYPADYDSHPAADRKRISAAVRSRRRRTKTAETVVTALTPSAGIPAAIITRNWVADRFSRLSAWTKGTGSMERKLRGRERELLKAVIHYHALSLSLGRQPSHAEFAAKLGCTRRAAQNRMRILVSLHSGVGPWNAKA